jgi:hypothetical protein
MFALRNANELRPQILPAKAFSELASKSTPYFRPQYGTMIFSILGNQPNRSGYSLVSAINQIVVKLTTLHGCEEY